jgi:hypothetical protein
VELAKCIKIICFKISKTLLDITSINIFKLHFFVCLYIHSELKGKLVTQNFHLY